MPTEKNHLQAVATIMDLAPKRDAGHLDAVKVEHLERAEELLLTLPPRRLMGAVQAWNKAGRPCFNLTRIQSHEIPGTTAADERKNRGRFGIESFR